MKSVKLPNGKEYLVGIRHARKEMDRGTLVALGYHSDDIKEMMTGPRFTEVFLKEGDPKGPVLATAEAICSFSDNFCRRTGRKVAASRLLKKLKEDHGITDKQTLKTIFLAVCPEFNNN